MAVQNTYQKPGENQVLNLLQYFTELESQHRVNNLAAKKTSLQTLQLQEKFLQNAIDAHRQRKNLHPEEKKTLQYLRHALRRNRAQQAPTLGKRLLYSGPVNWLFNRLLGRQVNFHQHDAKIIQFEKKTALEVNTANLTQEMKDHGFRLQLDGPLKRLMEDNLKEFAVPYYDIAKPDTDYILHFKRMDGSDAYVMEKFDATHRRTRAEVLRDPSPPEPVTVYLSDKVVFNAEEARQLAAARPLEKLIAGEKVFVIPDRKEILGIRKIYFDLERELGSFTIDEMAPGRNHAPFLSDLSKGMEREATLQLPGGSRETVHIRMQLDESRENYHLVFHSREGFPLDIQLLMRYPDSAKSFGLPHEHSFDNSLSPARLDDEPSSRKLSPNVEKGMEVYKKILLAKAQQTQLSMGLR